MSYIQIEIGGRKRGIKFSQGTNILLQDKLTDMDESERKAFGVQYIIWAGLKTNCIIKGERLTKDVVALGPPEEAGKEKEVPATIEDVFEWVEKLPQEVILDIVNLYTEVNAAVSAAEPAAPADTDEKKNLTTPQAVIESDVVS